MTAAVVKAPAKLTLSLRVKGRRPDGYHVIESEMVSLDFCDELTIEPAERSELVVEGPASRGVLGGRRNLVTRALEAVGRTASVKLVKNIPAGAGLGGGSSDAAAIFRWAGCTDRTMALGIGADVPYCLVGGRALVTGVGETVEPLDYVEGSYTLLVPPLHVPTMEVYGAWDGLDGPVGDTGNDLEPAALVVEPGLAMWRDQLAEATGQVPRLAGSGSTWFVEGAFAGVKVPGAQVVVAATVPPGWGG